MMEACGDLNVYRCCREEVDWLSRVLALLEVAEKWWLEKKRKFLGKKMVFFLNFGFGFLNILSMRLISIYR